VRITNSRTWQSSAKSVLQSTGHYAGSAILSVAAG
jgi:hypothetical protein